MRRYSRISLVILLLPAFAAAQGDREGYWDAGFHVANHSSLSLSGFGGASMQVDGDTGYGFSGAYNFTDHIALGLDASWRRPNYVATFVPNGPGPTRIIGARMDVSRVHFKGIFYFLESRITPFIELGVGWTNIDSNILQRPPITGCWWDPWWGLICQNVYSTYTETKTSYGGAVGIRWDTRGNVALRGSIGVLEIDRARGVQNSSVDTTQLELVWRF